MIELLGYGEGGLLKLMHASRLLALSLTDEMIDSIRADFGNTNAAVLKHWKAEVLASLPPAPSVPAPEEAK